MVGLSQDASRRGSGQQAGVLILISTPLEHLRDHPRFLAIAPNATRTK